MQYSSDERLVALVKKGDHQAFSLLVKRHTNALYHLALRTTGSAPDSEDIVQSVLLKFWQQPHKWQIEKSRLSTWFFTVVLNACRDWQRKQSSNSKRLFAAFDSHLQTSKTYESSEENLLEKRQDTDSHRDALVMAIANLPLKQRDAINLVVFCELSQSQTAQVLGVSVKAVESLLVRAKRTLAKKAPLQLEKSLKENTSEPTPLPKEGVSDV